MMKKLEKNEMMMINGGAVNLGFWALIGSGIVFMIGLIDGFVRPLKCN